ncbi:hypothetical protein Ancab_039453 [Ancistrocladus abbreviatus]
MDVPGPAQSMPSSHLRLLSSLCDFETKNSRDRLLLLGDGDCLPGLLLKSKSLYGKVRAQFSVLATLAGSGSYFLSIEKIAPGCGFRNSARNDLSFFTSSGKGRTGSSFWTTFKRKSQGLTKDRKSTLSTDAGKAVEVEKGTCDQFVILSNRSIASHVALSIEEEGDRHAPSLKNSRTGLRCKRIPKWVDSESAGLEGSGATRIFNGFETFFISGGRPNSMELAINQACRLSKKKPVRTCDFDRNDPKSFLQLEGGSSGKREARNS